MPTIFLCDILLPKDGGYMVEKEVKKKVVTYLRVSTSMQVEGYSIDAQLASIERYARAYDIEIVNVYKDEGRSGKSIAGRDDFIHMIEDIESGKLNVDYVMVFKLSRFDRNAADVLNSLQKLQEYNVNLICAEDRLDSSTGSGKLMMTILSAVAEIERVVEKFNKKWYYIYCGVLLLDIC
ncbi:recombinase family protein [Thermoanaerobacterium sp. R66]|nr:recombinase family protein [Thermoanaerobacterium sp. R66]MDE4541249.1 recombinase family protein [Thermoanaerobacterium sp. R66]